MSRNVGALKAVCCQQTLVAECLGPTLQLQFGLGLGWAREWDFSQLFLFILSVLKCDRHLTQRIVTDSVYMKNTSTIVMMM